MLIKSEKNPSGEYMRGVKLSHHYKHGCVTGMLLFGSSQEGLIEVHGKYFTVILKANAPEPSGIYLGRKNGVAGNVDSNDFIWIFDVDNYDGCVVFRRFYHSDSRLSKDHSGYI